MAFEKENYQVSENTTIPLVCLDNISQQTKDVSVVVHSCQEKPVTNRKYNSECINI